MIKVGVVGGAGYTGIELLRLLSMHPQVALHAVTSRTFAGHSLADQIPNLRGETDLTFTEPSSNRLTQCELVYFATPNGVAMQQAPELLEQGIKVIDLSADYRITDVPVWEHWYGLSHASPHWVEQAVYGLPEVNRQRIKQARLVANPGCYPTAIQLGFMPLIRQKSIRLDSLIADAKSGVSGAGRSANLGTSYCEVNDSFKAYAASGHRHHPEICQGLSQIGGVSVDLTFVPHLTPMSRGIHATLYADLIDAKTDVQSLFESAYASEPFVDVLPAGGHPETRSVKGANMCRIAIHRPNSSNKCVILSVIDNLVKGAAGQAIQNMNLMFGLDEAEGLNQLALIP